MKALTVAGRPALFVGASSVLAARLVEEAGFDGIWISSFEMSAFNGHPDANLLSLDQLVNQARKIRSAVDLPVIVDCDTGYSHSLNIAQMVREFQSVGIEALCFEDNKFPKKCSFYSGHVELEDPDVFAGHIRVAKQAQTGDHFRIVARTEAFIAGYDLTEALKRANKYADAGADLIMVHSKLDTDQQVSAFADGWQRDLPLVAVPTIYDQVTAATLYQKSFSLVIFANPLVRTFIQYAGENLRILKEKQMLSALDGRMASLPRVYELTDAKKFLD